MTRVLVVLCLLLAFSVPVYAQQPVGVNRVANAVYAIGGSAILNAMQQQVATGTFTLAGRAVPFTLGAVGIYAALDWFYNSARNTGTSLDAWRNWDGGMATNCRLWAEYQPQYSRYVAGNNGGASTAWNVGSALAAMDAFAADFRAAGIPQPAPTGPVYEPCFSAGAVRQFGVEPTSTGVPRPSLPDWVNGTYTPPSGQTAVPHPDALDGVRRILRDRILESNAPTPADVPSVDIGGSPPIIPVEWWTGDPSCVSGSVWDINVRACVNLTCTPPQIINPATNTCGIPPACPTGQYRIGSNWSCSPIPTCPTDQAWDSTTNSCKPTTLEPCPAGQERDPITRVCRPNDSCPPGEIEVGGVCQPVQCPAGQILDPVTRVCTVPDPTAVPPNPFDQLLARIGAAINRVVALGANKIPFGLASYFPSFSAGGSCDALDISMNLGATLGVVTLPICENPGVKFWHANIRPLLLGVFLVLGGLWIVRTGLQS